MPLPQPPSVFESTDARLADANLVYVGYCTSDAYAGAVSTSSVGFAFQGRAVVAAVMADLVAARGMGNVSGTRAPCSTWTPWARSCGAR